MANVDLYTPHYNLVRPYFDKVTWHDDINGNFVKLDTLLNILGALPNVDGEWAASTAYGVGDREYDSVSPAVYQCLVAHTSGTGSFSDDRTAHPSYWQVINLGLAPRGQWTTATVYKANDLAYQLGSTYIAQQNHTSGTFATDLAASKWALFAMQGATGPGTGDVVGPASSVDLRVAVFSGITGKLIDDSGTLLSALARVANPAFTGVPTAPTAAVATNTTQLATTAFVQAAVAALINSSPGALDTLSELATALGNDANFTTTVTNALALKAPLASPTFTGTPIAPTAGAGNNTTQLATTAFVATAIAGLTVTGVQEMFIPAGAFIPQITNGPSAGIVELATNKQPLLSLDYDATTQEYSVLQWIPAKRWDGGTITFVPYWTAASGSGGVVWSMDAVAVSDDDPLDAAYGTAQTSTDTFITANDLHNGPASSALTVAGSPADADFVWLRIARAPANASDTLAVDAKLIGIVLRWTANSGTDA